VHELQRTHADQPYDDLPRRVVLEGGGFWGGGGGVAKRAIFAAQWFGPNRPQRLLGTDDRTVIADVLLRGRYVTA